MSNSKNLKKIKMKKIKNKLYFQMLLKYMMKKIKLNLII